MAATSRFPVSRIALRCRGATKPATPVTAKFIGASVARGHTSDVPGANSWTEAGHGFGEQRIDGDAVAVARRLFEPAHDTVQIAAGRRIRADDLEHFRVRGWPCLHAWIEQRLVQLLALAGRR